MKTATAAIETPERDWYHNSIVTLKTHLSNLQDSLLALGKFIVEALDHNPRVREMWLKDVPMLSPLLLDNLERIGRRQILPEIYLNPSCEKLLTAPLSVQEQAVAGGVMVVIQSGKEHRASYKKPNELTMREAAQALKTGNVRSFEEQVEYMTPGPKLRRPDWEVDGEGNVIVHHLCVINRESIIAMADKILAKEKKTLESDMKGKQVKKG